MDCMFKQFCGREGRRTHLQKGSGQFDVEVLYLCDECREKYRQAIKRLEKETLKPEEMEELLKKYREGKLTMSEITDTKILIPISPENQKYIEGVCSQGAYSFQTFLEHLLNLYKRSLNEPLRVPETAEEPKESKKKPPQKSK